MSADANGWQVGSTVQAEYQDGTQVNVRITGIYAEVKDALETAPTVILVLGVNGAGKTTFIGKLSARLRREGKRVLVAAGDTFRAGAVSQLRAWAERTGADFVAGTAGAGNSQNRGLDAGGCLQQRLANAHRVSAIFHRRDHACQLAPIA